MKSCQQIQHLPASWEALLAQEVQDQKKIKQKSLADRISPTAQGYLQFPELLLETRGLCCIWSWRSNTLLLYKRPYGHQQHCQAFFKDILGLVHIWDKLFLTCFPVCF